MLVGYVALIGRPNSGKSTLLNNILKQKVSITSPKPQTTRSPIEAVYEELRGQILFIDTPGMFEKVKDPVSKKINPAVRAVLKKHPDVLVYLVDHTRSRSTEENKILGMIRKVDAPKILVFNKIDKKYPSYKPQYEFLKDEFDDVVEISGLHSTNLNLLISAIFNFLPKGKKIIDTENRPTPLINIDSKTFIAELVREKAFLFLRKETPYTLTTAIDEVTTRDNGVIYIKGRIITTSDRYKKMIIGKNGRMIKEISMAVRKEMSTATGKKIFVDLTVETNPHWHEAIL